MIDALLEDGTKDPKKLFNPKEYITHIIDVDGLLNDDDEENPQVSSKTEDEMALIISLLTDPAHKTVRHETLTNIKKEKKGETLLVAIAQNKNAAIQHFLIAACWEAELDLSKYLPFFVLLALDDNYLVSLEAMTVISTMEGPFDSKHVSDAIAKTKAKQATLTDEKAVLLNDLIDALRGFEAG
jgi:hypothetical protein